jgi:hypothetical protein
VTVTVNGSGAVLGIDYDKWWLVNAHEYNVSRETREAFRAAYELAGRQSLQTLLANSPLGAIQNPGTDPNDTRS